MMLFWHGCSKRYLQLFWKKYMTLNIEVNNDLERNSDNQQLNDHLHMEFKNSGDSNDLNHQQLLFSRSVTVQSYPSTTDSFEINICCSTKTITTKLSLIISLLTFASFVCIILFCASNYVKQALVALEESHSLLTFLCFLVLFILVSLPMTWGYVLLNLAAGYLYGVILGMVVVFSCALIGITVAHFLINHSSLKKCILNQISGNSSFRTVVSVVESRHGFKVIVLARLTPIPFGLQNALFALCQMNVSRYLCASAMGMIPTQGLHTYIGSTLRSMQDVVSTDNDNRVARIIFASQFMCVGALLLFVLRKAKSEFNKTLHEAESLSRQVTCV